MSVCRYCGAIGGYHYFGCAGTYRGRQLQRPASQPKAPRPTRIEWTGNIQVHHPVKVKP